MTKTPTFWIILVSILLLLLGAYGVRKGYATRSVPGWDQALSTLAQIPPPMGDVPAAAGQIQTAIQSIVADGMDAVLVLERRARVVEAIGMVTASVLAMIAAVAGLPALLAAAVAIGESLRSEVKGSVWKAMTEPSFQVPAGVAIVAIVLTLGANGVDTYTSALAKAMHGDAKLIASTCAHVLDKAIELDPSLAKDPSDGGTPDSIRVALRQLQRAALQALADR